ncbi:MAG TPA: DUF4097 family beta strand repeat-containing protein [Planococcus sp. (in: firmicutes)]|nr:DUF4097 family beta strand repeat-containing protein [Planococcus sp. (in: firmicutes)]
MKTVIRILLILILLGVIAVMLSIYNSEPAQQDVLDEQTFEEEVEEMQISTQNSRVDFLPSTDGTSRVVLTGNSDDFTLTADLSDGRLEIEIEDRSRFFNFDFSRSYSLQVYVPENGLASLSADSDNGAIQAVNIQADELALEADNGRIELQNVESERVHVQTDNGRIELTGMDAEIIARSSNGRITFTDVSGSLQAQASNGRIELTTATLDFPVDFETNNGRIEIRTDSEPTNARIQARVDNGNIDVYGQESEEVLFGDGDALIRLTSNNGSIVVQ